MFSRHTLKCVRVDGDIVKVRVRGMKKHTHYKFKFENKLYSAVLSNEGILLYIRKDGNNIPVSLDDPVYKKVKYTKGTTVKFYTCIKCGKDIRGLVHSSKRVCADCTRKRENETARKRATTKTRKVYTREFTDAAVRDTIKKYLETDEGMSNFIHTKRIFEWAINSDVLPENISRHIVKQTITVILPEFGYTLYSFNKIKCDRIFKRKE